MLVKFARRSQHSHKLSGECAERDLAPFVDGCVEVVGPRGNGHDLGNPRAQQGNNGDNRDKNLHDAAPC